MVLSGETLWIVTLGYVDDIQLNKTILACFFPCHLYTAISKAAIPL